MSAMTVDDQPGENPNLKYICERLNRISPGSYERLESLAELNVETGLQLVAEILGFACDAQSAGAIEAGRSAFGRLQQTWLDQHLPTAVERRLDLSDEWHFRRLLEILKATGSSLLRSYCETGLHSQNEEVREAARDFLPS